MELEKKMNSQQRILASLRGEAPDRIPWAPLIDEYFLASLPKSFQQKIFSVMIEEYAAPSQPLYMIDELRTRIIEFTRYIGADILERHAPGLQTHIEDL